MYSLRFLRQIQATATDSPTRQGSVYGTQQALQLKRCEKGFIQQCHVCACNCEGQRGLVL